MILRSFNSMLLFSLFVLFYRVILAQEDQTPTPPSSQSNITCPAFPIFDFWLRNQCPAKVGRDLKCVIGLPSDVPWSGSLNCGTVSDNPNASLQVINASAMLELVRLRDVYGRPWCMLSLFYSPSCVFSAKVAESFYRVAPLFPKLKVVAVDVSVSGKGSDSLISHFGIASTPVMALWENGFPRFRLYDDYSKLESLARVIELQTDLRRKNPLTGQNGTIDETNAVASETIDGGQAEGQSAEEGAKGDQQSFDQISLEEFLGQFKYLKDDQGVDWYFLLAMVTLILNLVYFLSTSPKAREFLNKHAPNFIVRNTAIHL